ncbi:tyrosine-type recombinase/integrase [Streptomyces sp. NPDC005732]|uniref:tyrosine-type recombinase/integrase n=1 Tax=Streptomyces sp. NPDC005732 TaxID=3157057 RepID=UPI0033DA81A1
MGCAVRPGSGCRVPGRVLGHEPGQRWRPSRRACRRSGGVALKDAGITKPDGSPKYTPHGLRHFFASTALAHGIPLHEASRWLGHRSIKTTVDVYGHLVPASWDRCRTIMQNALRPDGPAV